MIIVFFLTLQIFSFIYIYYRLVVSCFIQQIIISYQHYLFNTQIVPDTVSRTSFKLLTYSYCLCISVFSGAKFFFQIHSVPFLRSCSSFQWTVILRSQNLECQVSYCFFGYHHSRPSKWIELQVYMSVHTCTYMYIIHICTYIYICMSISLHIENHEFTYITPVSIYHHRIQSSLSLCIFITNYSHCEKPGSNYS